MEWTVLLSLMCFLNNERHLVMETNELSLREIQAQIREWADRNFKNNTSKATGAELGSVAPLLGIVEEAGELSHCVLKRHEGIRGYDDDAKYTTDRDDALADILVYLCDFAGREGVDLLSALNKTWARVRQRDWEKNKVNAAEIVDAAYMTAEPNEICKPSIVDELDIRG